MRTLLIASLATALATFVHTACFDNVPTVDIVEDRTTGKTHTCQSAWRYKSGQVECWIGSERVLIPATHEVAIRRERKQ